MKDINIYIGYDSSNLGQEMAYRVCRRSILKHSNSPINIYPIRLSSLQDLGIFNRDKDDKQSTEFTYTRFLVPYLNNYTGYSVFCDSDFLWQCDIKELLQYIDTSDAVSCVKHSYVDCPSTTKMNGVKQEWYPKKNWSSLMLFNCEHPDCKNLSPQAVNTEQPRYLHRMEWTKENGVGEIPLDYNYLVDYYNFSKQPKALHFTDGGPWHQDYTKTSYAQNWLNYLTPEEALDHKNGAFWGALTLQ
jgi:lipopolysaccharide biosynthesis glycosyltransferase